METSCSLSRVGLRGALDEVLAEGGGIFTAEDGNVGSFTGLFRGIRDGRGVELAMGKGSKSKRVVLSGTPISGAQGSG